MTNYWTSLFRATVLGVLVMGNTLSAADWKVGLARRDITPTESIYLAGHVNNTRFSEKALHPIWIKAAAFEDARGRRAVIVTADIFGMQRPKTDEVWDAIEKKIGLGRDRVAINFSHCHALPLLAGTLPPAYRVLVETSERWDVIHRYTKRVQDGMVAAVVEAVGNLRPAVIDYGEDACDIRDKDKDIKPYTGEIDRDRSFHDRVPVLRVKDAKGALIAILFGYPTHAQSAGNIIHGGYMGFAMLELEKKYSGAQAMFLLGTGALTTIRGFNHPVFSPEASEETGALLSEAAVRALEKPMEPIRGGTIACAVAEVELPFASPLAKEQLLARRRESARSDYLMRRDEFLIAYEEKHGKPLGSYKAIEQVFRIGDDLTFIFLSGETAEGYGYRLSELEYPDRRVWVTGFNNDQFAYVPTEGVLNGPLCRVGGASQTYWGWPSKWAKGIEDRIVGTVKGLVAKVDGP
ncbi:MAG: neutral/alkaline non-lysosomal ceramidase N-terminal domain-containing protein [Kiritimatiellia bacterium]